jgi:glycosyltransferase involved in cell wall biosynthesis
LSLRLAQIVVCSNQAHVLPRALDSVLEQSVLPDEILVGDDGSRDDTADVIEDYVRRHPKRIRAVLLPEPRGAAALRNACVLASGAELLSILEADEELLPGKLEAEQREVRAQFPGYEVYYSSYRVVSARGARPRIEPRARAGAGFLEIARGSLRLRNHLFSRRLYDEIGGFDERVSACAQWKFDLELLLRTRAWRVEGVHAVCPERGAAAEPGAEREIRDCVARVCDDLRRRYGLLPRERRALAATRLRFAWRAARGPAALAHLLRGCVADPVGFCAPAAPARIAPSRGG